MTEAIEKSDQRARRLVRDGQSKLVEVTSAIIEKMNESFCDNSKRLRDETDDAVRRVVEQIATRPAVSPPRSVSRPRWLSASGARPICRTS